MFNSIAQTFLRLTQKKQASLIICLALLVCLPSLFSGLLADDFLHYMIFNDLYQWPRRDDLSMFNLFAFVSPNPADRQILMAHSYLPWWTGADFSWNFWRPLAELTHYVDYVFLGDHFSLMHLHSLLWFALLLFLVYRFFARIFSESRQALLAMALFALNLSHALPVAWLSNRHALIASVFILAGLIAHLRFVDSGDKRFLFAATLFTALAFLSSELGISIGLWLAAFTLFMDTRRWTARVLSLMPYFAVFLAWLICYRLGEFGIKGYSTFYIDPFSNPMGFIRYYLTNLPSIVLSQTLIIPAEVFYLTAYPFLALCLGFPLLFVIILQGRRVQDNTRFYFFLLAFLLLVIPASFSPAQDRNLLQVSLAFSGLFSLLCLHLLEHTRKACKRMGFTLLALHLLISPLLLIPMSYASTLLAEPAYERGRSLPVTAEDQIILFKAPMMETTYLYPQLAVEKSPLPARLWNLGGRFSTFEIRRVDKHRLHIKALKHYFNKNRELVARDPIAEPFLHQKIDLSGLYIEITATDAEGLPKELYVTTTGHPDRIKYFIWTKSGYEPLKLKPGESRIL